MDKALSFPVVRLAEAVLVADGPPVALVTCDGTCECQAASSRRASRQGRTWRQARRPDRTDLVLLAADMLGTDGCDACWVLETEPELGLMRAIFISGSQVRGGMS